MSEYNIFLVLTLACLGVAYFIFLGTEAGLRLYLAEIVELTQLALSSSSWSIKAQGAEAMVTIGEKLKANLGPPHLGSLLQSLLAALPGRTWTGKVNILDEPYLFTLHYLCLNLLKILN